MLYCVDKTTRYLLQSQKALSFAAAQPLRRAVKAKMRSSDALLWAKNPSFYASADGKLRLSELEENWRKEIGAYLTLRNFSSRA